MNRFISLRPGTLALAAVAVLTSAAQAAAPQPFDELIVFGDSGSDNGNDHIASGGLAVPPPYWGGRFSNGPLWVERLAERLEFGHPTERKPLPAPSEAGGTNYAYGGAEAGPGFDTDLCVVVDGTTTCVRNVGLQIESFFADGRTLDGDELIVVQAGANNWYQAHSAARAMGDHVRTLAAAGGKTFLVPNLERLTRYPAWAPYPAPPVEQFVATFNVELEEELVALEGTFDITIIRLDTLGFTEGMFSDPAAFGFSNVTDPACPGCGFVFPEPDAADTIVPNPEEYLYWDTFHWTAIPHRLLGDFAADAVEAALHGSGLTAGAVPEPATILLASFGVATTVICMRRRQPRSHYW